MANIWFEKTLNGTDGSDDAFTWNWNSKFVTF